MRSVIREQGASQMDAVNIPGFIYPRQALADILSQYQESIHNVDAHTLENIEKLRTEKSLCIVTGQQVGFMGGPLLTVAKILSCIHLARQHRAIPIFWAATEDHDVDEVAHTYLLSKGGDLRRYGVPLPQRHFVEDLLFTPKLFAEVERFGHAVDIDFHRAIAGSTRWAEAMIRILADLFRGTGLLFVEPHLLRPLAADFFQRERQEAAHFQEILRNTPGPLTFRQGETNLFYKTADGLRRRVLQNDQVHEVLSTGVAARPALQCKLIPTHTYVAGPNELAYWQQLPAYFAAHEIPFPHVAQRASLTFIPREAGQWQARGDLEPQQQHYLNNLLHPRNRPQERLLNYFYFHQPHLIEHLLGDFHLQAMEVHLD